MNVLFIIENYLPHIGGAEIVFRNLSEALVQEGHNVIILTRLLPKTSRKEVINGVRVVRIPSCNSRNLFTFFAIPHALRLARWADIIHTTTFNGAFPSWIGARLRKKPVVITVHEVWVGKWRMVTQMGTLGAWIHDLLERLIYLFSFDCYVCVSKSTAKDLSLRKVKKKNIRVIYNGVNYDFWDPSKYNYNKVRKQLGIGKRFMYLFHGRPGTSKGLHYLMQAVPLVIKKLPDSIFLALVSNNKQYKDEYERLRRMISKKGLSEHIILRESVPYNELPSYVRAADCDVIPSIAEGFGYSAAEGCALGTPVVTTSAGSLPEVVSGKHVLVPPKNSSALAKGIIDVANKKYKKTPLHKFTQKENTKGYLKIYEELL